MGEYIQETLRDIKGRRAHVRPREFKRVHARPREFERVHARHRTFEQVHLRQREVGLPPMQIRSSGQD